MGCARCHDHKFDPLAMSDYYALAGIFQGTQTMLSFRVDSKWNATALGGPRAALRLDDLEQIIDRHDDALVNGNTDRMSAEERTAHTALLEDAIGHPARPATVAAFADEVLDPLPYDGFALSSADGLGVTVGVRNPPWPATAA